MSLLTPRTHPKHDVIGYFWIGWNGQVYFCESLDPAHGYWLVNALDPADRRNISDHAPRRTFHRRNFQQWKAHEVEQGHAYWVVDTRNREGGFAPREITAEAARASRRHEAVFANDYEANVFAKRLQAALEGLAGSSMPAHATPAGTLRPSPSV